MTMCGNNSDSSSDYFNEKAGILEGLNKIKEESIELKNKNISNYEGLVDDLREQASDSESVEIVNLFHNLANVLTQVVDSIESDIEYLESDININEGIIEDFRSLAD